MTQAYRIRRHPNARRITLKVHPDQSLEVVVPPRVSQRKIDQMIRERADWIEAAQQRLLRQQQARPAELNNLFPTRIELPAVAAVLGVQYGSSGAKSRLTWPESRTLFIGGAKTPEHTAAALIHALKAIAKAELEPLLHYLANQHGFAVDRVTWRNQKSRWGSCRRVKPNVGRISLNVRLLLLPPNSARYVLLHELAHIQHPNHSAAFWQCVESMQPDYREHQHAIKQAARLLPRWVY